MKAPALSALASSSGGMLGTRGMHVVCSISALAQNQTSVLFIRELSNNKVFPSQGFIILSSLKLSYYAGRILLGLVLNAQPLLLNEQLILLGKD